MVVVVASPPLGDFAYGLIIMIDAEFREAARTDCAVAGFDPDELVACELVPGGLPQGIPDVTPILSLRSGLITGHRRPRWHCYLKDQRLRATEASTL